MKTQLLFIESLRIDKRLQGRVRSEESVVTEYAEAIAGGATFPPGEAFFDGSNYWLAHGLHRMLAHKQAGKKQFECQIIKGTFEDACWHAAAANKDQTSIRRTNADKRRSVELALDHAQSKGMSNRALAEYLAVSEKLVRDLRESRRCPINAPQQSDKETDIFDITTVTTINEKTTTTKVTGRDGKSYPSAATKVKPTLKDQVGHIVAQKHLEKIFEQIDELRSIKQRVDAVRRDIASAIKIGNPLFALFDHAQIDAQIEQIATHIRLAEPYSVCTQCGGDVNLQKGCRTCKGRGFLGRLQYDAMPADLK